MQCVLLLPGTLKITPLIQSYINSASLIIAVDGGIVHAQGLNVMPDLWVGDFDSLPTDISHPELMRYQNIEKRIFPCDKDLLDTEIALNIAKEKGATTCILLAGIGGRIDHCLALHLMPLQYSAINFIHTDGTNRLISLRQTYTHISVTKGQTFSLIPLQSCKNVSLIGAKWSFVNTDLILGSGQGLSNIALNDYIEISCEQGILWCIC